MLRERVPKILVIDDSDIVRRSAARCLRQRGYLVLEASNAQEALQLVGTNQLEVDVVLTDLVMPCSSGVEIIAEIRKRFPHVPVAYMTGHIGLSVRYESAPELGVPLLLKPFTPTALERGVREALVRSGWAESFGPAPMLPQPSHR